MQLAFKTEHIVPELKSATGLDAIAELVDHLVQAGTISVENAQPIVTAIRERENSMSTGVGFGIALPHASTPLISENIVAFGRSRKGIDFNSLDAQPVSLVVLVIVPASEKEKNFMTLARISRFLHGKSVRESLEQAANTDSISHILNGNPLLSVAC